MTIIIKAFTLVIILTSVQSLEPLSQESEDVFSKIVQLLSNKPKPVRRAVSRAKLDKVKSQYLKLTKNMKPNDIKRLLRDDENKDMPPQGSDDAGGVGEFAENLVENELKNSLAHKKSALLDKPYVESEGKNDYLVMRPDILDPFVTVIPNAMYINIEKKCVNWLDDCSLKGIRARLLRGVRSP